MAMICIGTSVTILIKFHSFYFKFATKKQNSCELRARSDEIFCDLRGQGTGGQQKLEIRLWADKFSIHIKTHKSRPDDTCVTSQ